MKKINPKLNQLMTLLNDGEFHSGSELGEKLNISRNAVNKYIKNLIAHDIDIESHKGIGYRLKIQTPMLDAKMIKNHVSNKDILGNLEILHTVNSTNDYLKAKTRSKNKIDFCFAEEQTQGRGRFGRYWHSPFATNLYFSFSWSTQKDITELLGLSLIISLSVLQGIKAAGIDDEILIKWPNDLIYQGKKLAGMLLEIEAESHGFSNIMTGVGINVNMLEIEKNTITNSWTSLAQITNKICDRNLIAGSIIEMILKNISLFDKNNLSYFIPMIQKYDVLKNQNITVIQGNKKISGLAKGIHEKGYLILQLPDKSEMLCASGETSILYE